ncbi:MAG: hypothetical protein J6386_16800 [Candidatus Synoicihabitans palmerolidicus]|nr:hypothetical protein [Candidatus Synoicihabitans palmerolidicus]
MPVFSAAAVIFLAINYRVIFDGFTLVRGAEAMFTDAVGGQELDIYPVPERFALHLINSLAPGLSWGIFAWAALGAGMIWHANKLRMFEDRLAVMMVVLFYSVGEFLPKKPPPDYGRYMLPCAPFVIWLAMRGVQFAWEALTTRGGRWGLSFAVILTVVIPATRSVQIVANLENDTRIQAVAWLKNKSEWAKAKGEDIKVMSENYATIDPAGVTSVADEDLIAARQSGHTHVLVSSFRYERYLEGMNMARQRPAIRRLGGGL